MDRSEEPTSRRAPFDENRARLVLSAAILARELPALPGGEAANILYTLTVDCPSISVGDLLYLADRLRASALSRE